MARDWAGPSAADRWPLPASQEPAKQVRRGKLPLRKLFRRHETCALVGQAFRKIGSVTAQKRGKVLIEDYSRSTSSISWCVVGQISNNATHPEFAVVLQWGIGWIQAPSPP